MNIESGKKVYVLKFILYALMDLLKKCVKGKNQKFNYSSTRKSSRIFFYEVGRQKMTKY